MIQSEQPTIFPPGVIAHVSSGEDNTMLNRLVSFHEASVVANRQAFCRKVGCDYAQTVFQRVEYDANQTYDTVVWVGQGDTTAKKPDVAADALITKEKAVGLFLPIADCIGIIFYDPKRAILAVAHVGRHASIARLVTKVVAELKSAGSDPADILVWFSPSAGKNSYRLDYFDLKDDPTWQKFCQQDDKGTLLDLTGYNQNLLIQAGVQNEHIQISAVDTVTSPKYFSHSAGDATKRFAVFTELR